MPDIDSDLSPSKVHQLIRKKLRPAQSWNGEDVPGWQRKLRRTLSSLSGYRNIANQERCELNVQVLWTREHALGRIDKIRFTTEPGCDTIAYLCLPHGHSGKTPWMICLQGHTTGAHLSVGIDADHPERYLADVPGDRDFGLGCMRRGVAALCMEQRCFGERSEALQECRHPQGCYDATMQALLLGRTMIAERVWDVNRALDYLWTRDDVDRHKVGIMGNSGGGTVSIYAAALLPRLRFVMPSCACCTFEHSIMARHHCGDNYIPGLLLEAEMSDIIGLCAPKPCVIVAGKDDLGFPIVGMRKAYREARRIYDAAGAAKHVKLVVGDGGHRFYADKAWAVALRMFDLV